MNFACVCSHEKPKEPGDDHTDVIAIRHPRIAVTDNGAQGHFSMAWISKRSFLNWYVVVGVCLAMLLGREQLFAAWHSNRGYIELVDVLRSHRPLSVYNPLQAAIEQQDEHFRQALDAFNLALDDQADYTPAVFGLSLLNLAFGNYTQAVSNFQVALLSRPGPANFGLGLALYKSGDLVGARTAWRDSLTVSYFRSLAQHQLGLGLVDDSIRLFEVIVTLTPDSVQAWLDLGEGYINQQNWDKAMAAYKQALAIDPDNVDAQLPVASIWLRGRNNPAQARELVEREMPRLAADHSLEGEIRLYGVYLFLNEIALKEANYDEAIAWLERAIALPRVSHQVAAMELARIYQIRGQSDQALLWMKRVLAEAPQEPWVHAAAGNLLKANGDLAGAIREYEQAVSLRPGNVNNRNALAWSLLEAGDRIRALEEFRKVLAVDPTNASATEGLRKLSVEP